MQERTLHINVFENVIMDDVLSISVKVHKINKKFSVAVSIDSFVRTIIGVTSFSRSPDFSL